MAQYTKEELEALSKNLEESEEKYGKSSNSGVGVDNYYTFISIISPNDTTIIGTILHDNIKYNKEFSELGLSKSLMADIIRVDIQVGEFKSYYIRFGALLKYLSNHIIPKIVTNDKKGVPYLDVDFNTKTNIMYTIPNQLSTDPEVCIIKNNFKNGNGNYIFFEGLEEYVGVEGNISYGKVMNIYLNIHFLRGLIEGGKGISDISIYKFLSNICDGINNSLGKVNNLEPVIDEATNTVYILEQTKIPGKDILIKKLGTFNPTPQTPPTLEFFGYNKDKNGNNTSNFVKSVGLKTAITKEYATMITIGATKNGYIPGEEATAFSRWNIGIEDRFKKGLKDADSTSTDPKEDFEEDNSAIVKNYIKYANGSIAQIIGYNDQEIDQGEEDKTNIINSGVIKSNTAAVANFNKYLQASASLANNDPEDVQSSVGFLPFNLSLTMDGISGIKIYNKLDVNTKFLPSNYPQSLEFVVTAVDHSLTNNSWETTLNTIGISKDSNKPNTIQLPINIPPSLFENDKFKTYVDETPWSAAFISWVIKDAGVKFPYTGAHTVYSQKIRDGGYPWIALNPKITQLKVGDIVVQNRGGALKWSSSSWSGFSHGDIVIKLSNTNAEAVGGNVSNTVKVKNIPLNNKKIISPNFFVVLRPNTGAYNIVKVAKKELKDFAGRKEFNPEVADTLYAYYKAGNLPAPSPSA